MQPHSSVWRLQKHTVCCLFPSYNNIQYDFRIWAEKKEKKVFLEAGSLHTNHTKKAKHTSREREFCVCVIWKENKASKSKQKKRRFFSIFYFRKVFISHLILVGVQSEFGEKQAAHGFSSFLFFFVVEFVWVFRKAQALIAPHIRFWCPVSASRKLNLTLKNRSLFILLSCFVYMFVPTVLVARGCPSLYMYYCWICWIQKNDLRQSPSLSSC